MIDIPEDVMKAAVKCAETVLRNMPDDYGDMSVEVRAIARAIMEDRATRLRPTIVYEMPNGVSVALERVGRALDGVLAANDQFLEECPNQHIEPDPITQACRRARRIIAGEEE